ncbi:hypothetical protein [Mycobacterium sp. SMC-4]|uniref:hypothetical protein n=1 Tax=Mycobacterium sp. SMC-4 TaxID=2857059 RepID=UPI003CFD15CB
MESSWIDLVELLGVMAVPASVLLLCRLLNRRWDRAAALRESDVPDRRRAPERTGPTTMRSARLTHR